MLTLFQVEWCPYCHVVRQAMTELGLDIRHGERARAA